MQLLRPLVFALLAAGLAGCSGTRFGDQLSRSFSQPSPPPDAAPAGAAPSPVAAAPSASPAAKPTSASPETPRAPSVPEARPTALPAKPPPPRAPVPYRITLQLPAADPSSPAESVTTALRAAGVAFEVESIERIPAASAEPVRTTMPSGR